MPKYIELEKALESLQHKYENMHGCNPSFYAGYQFALENLKKIKSADVAHVIHGKNLTECNPVDEFICSHCGAIFRDVALCEIDEDSGDETYYEFEFKHCPRCGMKVDLEEDK